MVIKEGESKTGLSAKWLRWTRRVLHKYIWRALPSGLRRQVLDRATLFLAPRPTRDAVGGLPVIVVGFLRQASGLGEAARACYLALFKAGIPVYGIDLTQQLGHEVNYPEFKFESGLDCYGSGTILLHVGGAMTPLALCLLGSQLIKDKRVIAHWFWELEKLPTSWRRASILVHEFCVNSHFIARAIQSIGLDKPIHVVAYPLQPGRKPRPEKRLEVFTVLVVFNVASNFARKNPIAAIQAFRRAFGDDPGALLILKYTHGDHWPPAVHAMSEAIGRAPNIQLRGELYSAQDMEDLYEQASALMSLHRSEGLGLTIAEAMRNAIPVIATDWSGSQELLTEDTGIPVAYDLIPVVDLQQNYGGLYARWADPNIEEASDALRRLRTDPVLRSELGRAGQRRVEKLLNEHLYCEQMSRILRKL